MYNLKLSKSSIASKLIAFALMITLIQALLLSGIMVLAGVLSEARHTSFLNLHDKVSNRNDYIQREMKNRWTNIEPYISQISKALSDSAEESLYFDVAPGLIRMLRSTQATGVFIVLCNGLDMHGKHSAIYLRDYDPLLNDHSDKDIYMIVGPSEVAKEMKIPLDSNWSYDFLIDDRNEDFYAKPYQKAPLTFNASLLGYWSKPFRVSEDDINIITYSMPLFDIDNVLRGVIGVEISLNYFGGFLPVTELQAKDSLGYLIAYKDEEDNLVPMIGSGALQRRIIRLDEYLSLVEVDSGLMIYNILNHNSSQDVYASVQKLGLYSYNTPFEGEEWYIVGMMTESQLLGYVQKLQRIIWSSMILSLAFGMVGGIALSYRLANPIVKLANKVKNSKLGEVLNLEPIGLKEVDELSSAMESANNNLLDSTLKLSRIIDLVEMPLGAFEIRDDSDGIFATDRLWEVLGVEQSKANDLARNKIEFLKLISLILERPDDQEDDVYLVLADKKRWVKFKLTEIRGAKLGVIIDVTDEIINKKAIMLDRDLDPLTKIYNRKAFQWRFDNWYTKYRQAIDEDEVAALIMFDLDNLKYINDSYGHKWGDNYIVSAVDALQGIATDNSILGRRSGDEFVMLVFGFESKDSIRRELDSFYRRLKATPIDLNGEVREIGISAGLVWIDKRLSYEDLLSYADEALYKSKSKGKGILVESYYGLAGD